MTTLSLPYLTFGIGSLLVGCGLCLRHAQPGTGRHAALWATALALLSFAFAAQEVHRQPGMRLLDPWIGGLESDALDAVPMIFYAALTLLLLFLAPRRDTQGKALAGMLLLTAATQIAYAASNLTTLAIGWWLTTLPFALPFSVSPLGAARFPFSSPSVRYLSRGRSLPSMLLPWKTCHTSAIGLSGWLFWPSPFAKACFPCIPGWWPASNTVRCCLQCCFSMAIWVPCSSLALRPWCYLTLPTPCSMG